MAGWARRGAALGVLQGAKINPARIRFPDRNNPRAALEMRTEKAIGEGAWGGEAVVETLSQGSLPILVGHPAQSLPPVPSSCASPQAGVERLTPSPPLPFWDHRPK